MQNTDQGKPANPDDLKSITFFFRRYENLSEIAYPLIIPPAPGQPRQGWSNAGTNLMDAVVSGAVSEPIMDYARMASAFNADKPAEFNRAISDYRVWLRSNGLTSALEAGGQEFFFNHSQPFFVSMVTCVAALILGCLYLDQFVPDRAALRFLPARPGLRLLHLRPGVPHVFAGPPARDQSLFLRHLHRLGGGALRHFSGTHLPGRHRPGLRRTHRLHHPEHCPSSGLAGPLDLGRGDTMEMLRAVLDTNLWLSTHVVVVTLGYASMFVAGLLAIIYIVRGFFTRSLTPELGRTLARMVYGIVCFATLFSFVGTILGGIWADQSWGRFWGWDPKENGALLIVLWNAMILHARWGGLIKERGLMAMAVFGNIVTSFSWFGVNMLGIGLHSYGFMDAAFRWLMFFDATQVALIILALTPQRHWASFKAAAPPPPPSGAPAAASI